MLKLIHKFVNKQFLSFAPKALKNFSVMAGSKTLQNVVYELEKFAPRALAEKWDNVGLLIEPYEKKDIKRIMLTNDLTERVMNEAIAECVDLIISYHPPVFAPLKRITQNHWKERIVSACLAKSIALYSPHTTWDAIPGGVNDWLASALKCNQSTPIQPSNVPIEGAGSGRIFDAFLTLREAIDAVQKHINLDVQVAFGELHSLDTRIKTVAVCAGSGAWVLKGVRADLYITGEMSHHELLDANQNNVSVILCNHSNSERGFLTIFQEKLHKVLNGECTILVSKEDRDPLKMFIKN